MSNAPIIDGGTIERSGGATLSEEELRALLRPLFEPGTLPSFYESGTRKLRTQAHAALASLRPLLCDAGADAPAIAELERRVDEALRVLERGPSLGEFHWSITDQPAALDAMRASAAFEKRTVRATASNAALLCAPLVIAAETFDRFSRFAGALEPRRTDARALESKIRQLEAHVGEREADLRRLSDQHASANAKAELATEILRTRGLIRQAHEKVARKRGTLAEVHREVRRSFERVLANESEPTPSERRAAPVSERAREASASHLISSLVPALQAERVGTYTLYDRTVEARERERARRREKLASFVPLAVLTILALAAGLVLRRAWRRDEPPPVAPPPSSAPTAPVDEAALREQAFRAYQSLLLEDAFFKRWLPEDARKAIAEARTTFQVQLAYNKGFDRIVNADKFKNIGIFLSDLDDVLTGLAAVTEAEPVGAARVRVDLTPAARDLILRAYGTSTVPTLGLSVPRSDRIESAPAPREFPREAFCTSGAAVYAEVRIVFPPGLNPALDGLTISTPVHEEDLARQRQLCGTRAER